ncbi:hypothetical protein NL676_016720 [Syzygium grande]|nr:hypothetical protein NL676_016720 [Syzygium grande]
MTKKASWEALSEIIGNALGDNAEAPGTLGEVDKSRGHGVWDANAAVAGSDCESLSGEDVTPAPNAKTAMKGSGLAGEATRPRVMKLTGNGKGRPRERGAGHFTARPDVLAWRQRAAKGQEVLGGRWVAG